MRKLDFFRSLETNISTISDQLTLETERAKRTSLYIILFAPIPSSCPGTGAGPTAPGDLIGPQRLERTNATAGGRRRHQLTGHRRLKPPRWRRPACRARVGRGSGRTWRCRSPTRRSCGNGCGASTRRWRIDTFRSWRTGGVRFFRPLPVVCLGEGGGGLQGCDVAFEGLITVGIYTVLYTVFYYNNLKN